MRTMFLKSNEHSEVEQTGDTLNKI